MAALTRRSATAAARATAPSSPVRARRSRGTAGRRKCSSPRCVGPVFSASRPLTCATCSPSAASTSRPASSCTGSGNLPRCWPGRGGGPPRDPVYAGGATRRMCAQGASGRTATTRSMRTGRWWTCCCARSGTAIVPAHASSSRSTGDGARRRRSAPARIRRMSGQSATRSPGRRTHRAGCTVRAGRTPRRSRGPTSRRGTGRGRCAGSSRSAPGNVRSKGSRWHGRCSGVM